MLGSVPHYWEKARLFLAEKDKVLADIMASYHDELLMSRGSAFYSLVRSVVGQQISVKAAESIWKKVEQATGDIIPDNMMRLEDETLRTCGLSRQKVLYLRELCRFFSENPSHDWHGKKDTEVIGDLVTIKGIGRWSAEMFLIFHLLRPDVFPLQDIGLQKAIAKHYNAGIKMPLAAMQSLSGKWQPYRTVATWYLWRSLDPVAVEY